MGMPRAFITEANSTIVFRESGVLSKLYTRVISNDHTTLTFRTRIAGADGNLTVSYGASETGVKTDDVNTDTITAGQSVALRYTQTGGATNAVLTISAFVFTPTSGRPTFYTNQANGTVSNSSVTEFIGFAGRSGSNASEADRRFRALTSGRLKYLTINGTNNGANTMTWRSRVNGVFGNLLVSIASAGSNGEDASNEDTIAAGDEIGLAVTTGAGMVSSGFPLIAAAFIPNSGFQYVASSNAIVAAGATQFFPVGGDLTGSTTESNFQVRAAFAQRLSKLSLYVTANTLSSDSTFVLRKNGATAISLTIGAGVTGFLQNAVDLVDVAPADLINYRLVTGGTGTDIELSYAAMLADAPLVASDVPLGWVGQWPTVVKPARR
jgi:hypothetical protein